MMIMVDGVDDDEEDDGWWQGTEDDEGCKLYTPLDLTASQALFYCIMKTVLSLTSQTGLCYGFPDPLRNTSLPKSAQHCRRDKSSVHSCLNNVPRPTDRVKNTMVGRVNSGDCVCTCNYKILVYPIMYYWVEKSFNAFSMYVMCPVCVCVRQVVCVCVRVYVSWLLAD
jgi:hypothetical protein